MSDSATLWTIAHQALLSMGFSRQEYQSGLPFSAPGDLPDRGIEPASLTSPALVGRFFTTSNTLKAHMLMIVSQKMYKKNILISAQRSLGIRDNLLKLCYETFQSLISCKNNYSKIKILNFLVIFSLIKTICMIFTGYMIFHCLEVFEFT